MTHVIRSRLSSICRRCHSLLHMVAEVADMHGICVEKEEEEEAGEWVAPMKNNDWMKAKSFIDHPQVCCRALAW